MEFAVYYPRLPAPLVSLGGILLSSLELSWFPPTLRQVPAGVLQQEEVVARCTSGLG